MLFAKTAKQRKMPSSVFSNDTTEVKTNKKESFHLKLLLTCPNAVSRGIYLNHFSANCFS